MSLSLSFRETPRTPATPKTPKNNKKHYNKYELDNIPSQNFKVGYQKVTLDVDLEQNCIEGETEITVLPLDSSLKYMKLDCRGIQIKSIIVNERRAQFSYDDFLQNQEYMNNPENPVLSNYNYDPYFDSNTKNLGVNQHHMLRTKFYPIFSDQNDPVDPISSYPTCTSELVIKIPESIKLRLQNASKSSFISPIGTARSGNNTPINTFTNSDKVYTPLNIKIIYTVKNMKNGILFNGGKHTNVPKNLWYCYTFNNDYGCSASSWVPCIDNFYEKPSWDINIIVPKTVGDIGSSKIIGTKAAEKELQKIALRQLDVDDSQLKEQSLDLKKISNADHNQNKNNINSNAIYDEDDDDDDDDDLEGTIDSIPLVVTVPDLVSSRESPHPLDVVKKVVNFQFYNPVCAHHLGFAVGAFEKIPIVDVKPGTDELTLDPISVNEDEVKDVPFNFDSANSNKVTTMLYYIPGQKHNVINSTIFLYKALDFYSKEFSSFPFTSYTLLFIDDLPCDTCTFAGMTIVSSRLLYGPNMIEPMFNTTEILAVALAEQYSGVNVLPKTLNDIWCTIGIARYMSGQFLKKLFGVNYYKFMMEKRCELLSEIDVGKRPLANQLFRFPINMDQDLEFIQLKAPLVLSILDKRITKTDKLFGLSRVIPKIFLQAMSNDLINGNNLSTAHFQRVCEKVAHHKLEAFFQNWIHNSGVPIFRITQKFNKKRLFIEMTIRQMQRSNLSKDEESSSVQNKDFVEITKYKNFVDDANTVLVEVDETKPQSCFTGTVTIRIHETDGSPYEHIMSITDPVTKMDIQYNTKYRRRRREKRDGTDDIDDKDGNEKEKDSKKKERETDKSEIYTLGDLLSSNEELENWGLIEENSSQKGDGISHDTAPDDDKDEAFEWLRFDADNEWICRYTINLTDEKFESQIKQDRDVEAQYESVRHFGSVNHPTAYHGKVLIRTLIDSRYFYGIREEAAKSLAKISNKENDHIGMRLLLKAFKHLYCYENKITKEYDQFDPKQYLPKPNDFTNFSNLFVMQAILKSLASVRNEDGDSPIELKRIILNILKYYDNSNNEFDGTLYYASIIVSIFDLIIVSHREIPLLNIDYTTKASEFGVTDSKDEFIFDALKEINRCLKMDEWAPSYKQHITKVILEQKIRLAQKGLAKFTFFDLLKYTTANIQEDIRLIAFEGLLLLGGLKNAHILDYYFSAMKLDESQYIRYKLNKVFVKCVGFAAFNSIPSLMEDKEFLETLNCDSQSKDETNNRMIQIENSSSAKLSMKYRMDQLARKSIKGSVDILRRDLGIGKGLQHELWNAIHSCLIPINTRRNIFDIMMILFEPRDSFVVTTNLPNDKRIFAKIKTKITNENTPSIVVSLKREAKFKIQLPSFKLKVPETKGKHKRTLSTSAVLPAPIKKTKKKNNVKVETNISDDKFLVTLNFHGKRKYNKTNKNIIYSNPNLPLRYVCINLRTKKVTVSTDEDFGKSKEFIVKLNINPAKLKDISTKAAEPLNESSNDINNTNEKNNANIIISVTDEDKIMEDAALKKDMENKSKITEIEPTNVAILQSEEPVATVKEEGKTTESSLGDLKSGIPLSSSELNEQAETSSEIPSEQVEPNNDNESKSHHFTPKIKLSLSAIKKTDS